MSESNVVEDYEKAEKSVFWVTMILLIGIIVLLIGLVIFVMKNPPHVRSHCLKESQFIPAWEPY